MPSATRNFFGKVVDRILPGSNYNATTGQYSNIGKGIAGLGARLGATMLAGPAVGALVGKGAGYLIDHTGKIGPVTSEGVPVTSNVAVSLPGVQVSQPAISNLGLGAESPGSTWAGYTQGAGSINNFGNTQFGNGQATQPGQWSPSSAWGQQLAANQGSNLGFGNNVSEFAYGGGGGGSSGGGSYASSGRMPGIFGGRPAGDSMLDIARRWASS